MNKNKNLKSQNSDSHLRFAYQLPHEKMVCYLNGDLSKEEEIAVEQYLAENPIEKDAMEGLKLLRNQFDEQTLKEILHPSKEDINEMATNFEEQMLLKSELNAIGIEEEHVSDDDDSNLFIIRVLTIKNLFS